MNQCILCKRSDLIHLAWVKKTLIYECSRCQLGISSKLITTKKILYGTSRFYSPVAVRKNIDNYVEKFERVIERMSMFVSEGNILDVGGGFGLFSDLISREKHLKVTMIEPHLKPFFLEGNKRVTWVKKQFMNFRGRRGTYSAITFLDVLEHFKDPLEVLHKTRILLKEKGYVVVLLPNYQSTMRLLSNNWPWWMLEDHYFHFSRQSLKKIFDISGFRLVYLESFENRNDFWLSLQGNYKWIQNIYFRKLLKILTIPALFIGYLILRPLLWRLYNGGLLLAIAQKK